MKASDVWFSHTDDDGEQLDFEGGCLEISSRNHPEASVELDVENARRLADTLTQWAELTEAES